MKKNNDTGYLEKVVRLFELDDNVMYGMSNEIRSLVENLIPCMDHFLIERVVGKLCDSTTPSNRNALSILSGLVGVDDAKFAVSQVAMIDDKFNARGNMGSGVLSALVKIDGRYEGTEAVLAMGRCLSGGRYDMGNMELNIEVYTACRDEFMIELVRRVSSQSMYQTKRKLLNVLGHLSWRYEHAFTKYFMPLFVRSTEADKDLMVSAISLQFCKDVPSIETELVLIMLLQEKYTDHTSDVANVLLSKMLCYNDTALAMANHLIDCEAYIENLPTVLNYMEDTHIPNAYQIEELCYRMLTESPGSENIEEATQTLIHLGKVHHVGIIDVISERVKNCDDEFLTDYLHILAQNGLAWRILEALPAESNMSDLPYLTALNDMF